MTGRCPLLYQYSRKGTSSCRQSQGNFLNECAWKDVNQDPREKLLTQAENQLQGPQYGFRQNRSTSGRIFTLRPGLVDLEKAFDRVPMRVIKKTGEKRSSCCFNQPRISRESIRIAGTTLGLRT